jgi:hypothetical protein
MAAYGFALTATHFFSNAKKVSKKGSPQASGPSLRLGVPSLRYPSGGIALRLASLAPTCDVFDCVERRCAPIPRMNTSTQPPEGAGRSRSKAEGELTLGLMSGEERVYAKVFL